MAITIMLQGDFDYDALYEVLGDRVLFEHVSNIEPQRYSFRLRGVTDVFYQVYPTGKVRIDTDDYSDPYDLIRIIWEAARLASGYNPRFKILRYAPLLSSCYRIARPLILEKLDPGIAHEKEEAATLVYEEAARIKRVYEAIQNLALPEKGEG